MELNRFEVPVQAAILRKTGWPTTNASPAKISSRSRAGPARPASPVAAFSGPLSLARISRSETVETPYDRASTVIAPARRKPNRTLPRPGPATWANDWVAPSLPFPSISCARPIREGR